MSLKDYENVIIKAHDMGALWPERCVRREDIASVEAKLGVKFSEQILDFYTNCDDDGNIAYFDFSRMKDGEPLVTIAYFGEEGFVITSETDCDFGAFLLKSLNNDPSVSPPKIAKLAEDQAYGLLQYVEKRDIKFFSKITFPKIICGLFIAFAAFVLIVGTEQYLILVYDNIYPWDSINCVNIRRANVKQQAINLSYDQEDRDRLINAYAVEIHFKSGLTRSNLYVSLTPQDLSEFAEYLRTKVPEVHRS